jgi:hypothetical protein
MEINNQFLWETFLVLFSSIQGIYLVLDFPTIFIAFSAISTDLKLLQIKEIKLQIRFN